MSIMNQTFHISMWLWLKWRYFAFICLSSWGPAPQYSVLGSQDLHVELVKQSCQWWVSLPDCWPIEILFSELIIRRVMLESGGGGGGRGEGGSAACGGERGRVARLRRAPAAERARPRPAARLGRRRARRAAGAGARPAARARRAARARVARPRADRPPRAPCVASATRSVSMIYF